MTEICEKNWFVVDASIRSNLDSFGEPSDEEVEWWTFPVQDQGEDDGQETLAAQARVALFRDAEDHDFLGVADFESVDLGVVAGDVTAALRREPMLLRERGLYDVAVVDHVDVLPAYRGQRLSQRIVEAIQRFFPNALLVLTPSDLDIRHLPPEASDTAGTQTVSHTAHSEHRSPKNYQSLQNHWLSVGFEKLGGRTLAYLPEAS